MKDVLMQQLENLMVWVQNNPFTTIIILVVIVVALLFIASIIRWLTD